MANRTVLLSIDVEAQFDRFGDYGPGIGQSTVTKSQADRDASFWGAMGGTWSDDLPLNPVLVGTVKDRGAYYPEVFDRDELFEVDLGFYFNHTLQIVYVKFLLASPWFIHELLDYGQSLRFIDAAGWDAETQLANQAYIDGVYAAPRIVPDSYSYRQTMAPMKENRMSFDDMMITLINADGGLDDLRERSIGRKIRAYFSSLPDLENADSLNDFVQTFDGTVKAVSFDGGRTVTITGADPRGGWKATINTEPLTLAEFPDMDPKLENQYKSLVVGELFSAPCVNVSSEGNNRTWSVNSIINGEATLNALYDGDPDEFTPIVPSQYTYTPSTGVVVLVRDPQGPLRADITGSGVTSRVTGLQSYRAADLALAALDLFGNLPYIDSFWDKSDVAIVQARSPETGVFIEGSDPIELKEFIDKLLSGANTRVYLKSVPDADGVPRVKYSMRDINQEGFPITYTILPEDLIDIPLSWGFDEEAHMTSIAVKYVPSIFNEVWAVHRDRSLEEEAYENTPSFSEYTYESFCTDTVEVAALALQRYEEGILVPYRISGESGKELAFAIGDYVRYHHVRAEGQQILEPATWRVIEIDLLNRVFKLALIQEDEPKIVTDFTGDMFGPFTMYNDNLYANIQGRKNGTMGELHVYQSDL